MWDSSEFSSILVIVEVWAKIKSNTEPTYEVLLPNLQ